MDAGRVHAIIIGHENHGHGAAGIPPLTGRCRDGCLATSFGDAAADELTDTGTRPATAPFDGRVPFDAVLMIAFGGPQGPAEIRPFLANVLRARRVPPERVEAVAHHYELFGGVSPITAITTRQAQRARRPTRASAGCALPVYVGMRNWRPLLADTLREMAAPRRAPGDWPDCRGAPQLLELRAVPAERLAGAGGAARTRRHAAGDRLRRRLAQSSRLRRSGAAASSSRAQRCLPDALRRRARVVFTAHSIPVAMVGGRSLSASSCGSRRRPWLERWASRAGPSPTRAGAAGPRTRGSSPISTTTYGPSGAQGLDGRGAVAARVRGRSHRGAVRPRHRSTRHLRRGGPGDRRGRPPSTTIRASSTRSTDVVAIKAPHYRKGRPLPVLPAESAGAARAGATATALSPGPTS